MTTLVGSLDEQLVSVVMTVYNGEAYLSEAIRSILSQSHRNFEFIIIDDASSDDSQSIIGRFASKDSRIRAFSNVRNLGRSASAALGLGVSRADVVFRMDADDVSLPERFERQLAYLAQRPEVDVLGTQALEIDECGEITGRRSVPTGHESIVRTIWANPIIHPSVVFRRSRVLAVGGYNPKRRFHEDYDLWFRCTAGGLRFDNLDTPLLLYRRHVGQQQKRRSLAWAASQVRTGVRGCVRVRASPIGYVAAIYPAVRGLMPTHVGGKLDRFTGRLDPRTRAAKVEV